MSRKCPKCGEDRSYPLGLSFNCPICREYMQIIEKPHQAQFGVNIMHGSCRQYCYIPPSAFCPECGRLKKSSEVLPKIKASTKVSLLNFSDWYWSHPDFKRVRDLGLYDYDFFWAYCSQCNFKLDSYLLMMSVIHEADSDVIFNASSPERNKQWEAIRRHECPSCGSSEMQVIVGEIP